MHLQVLADAHRRWDDALFLFMLARGTLIEGQAGSLGFRPRRVTVSMLCKQTCLLGRLSFVARFFRLRGSGQECDAELELSAGQLCLSGARPWQEGGM